MVLSHWCQLIENLQASPLAFYQSVEMNLMRRAVPALDYTRVEYHEASILSAKREYLRLSRDKLAFDICAAPFGTGFFVSWRLVDATQGSAWLLWSLIAGIAGMCGILVFSTLTLLAKGFLEAFGTFILLTMPFCILMAVNLGIYFLLRFWLLRADTALANSPFVGTLYKAVIGRDTYYKIDTMLMFQAAVKAAVLEAVDGLTTAQNLRPLSDEERKPVMIDLFNGQRR
jgi:hypothetical protein